MTKSSHPELARKGVWCLEMESNPRGRLAPQEKEQLV
jgi:hypothetical protein